jgi:hypothetical protein
LVSVKRDDIKDTSPPTWMGLSAPGRNVPEGRYIVYNST